MNRTLLYNHRVQIAVSVGYFLLVGLYFSPLGIVKITFPLVYLTLCALRYASWPMVMAMLFSALGDWMGMCSNFWGQMGAFAIAHVAFIIYFCKALCEGGPSDGKWWKWSIVGVYGLMVGCLIVPYVQGVLQIGVAVYILLILAMCGCAWMQKNRYYVWGAWLFVFSDTVLAWNKFVSPIEYIGYLIMVPYYLGQWTLFITSIAPRLKNVSCTE